MKASILREIALIFEVILMSSMAQDIRPRESEDSAGRGRPWQAESRQQKIYRPEIGPRGLPKQGFSHTHERPK
ncbi:hypothetical protein KVP10_09430 [Candidimonas humi]|uniref:Secreted protein n=1 Tax=Candidimonas humi TaxID=683355 RepID=A0ABV8NXB1_9BURK|nr:hypothetical protein [Candidimonas humi]MBV6305108.1 hypothetical protein [Candidimonas humi]